MRCGYQAALLRLGRRLPRGRVLHVLVQHDDWCEVVGGDGSQPCVPRFVLDGEDVTVLAAEDGEIA
jgi:hypothetical protein